MTARTGFLGLAVIVVAGGCYQYVPTTMASVPEGAQVRALLTPQAHQRLREVHQVDTELLEGTVLSRNGDQLSLLVPSGPMPSDFGRQQVFYQQVEVTQGDVLRADLRRVDAVRTGSLVALAVATAAVVIVEATSGGGPGERGPDGGVPPESVRAWLISIPLVRW